jgi:hypothetical protein
VNQAVALHGPTTRRVARHDGSVIRTHFAAPSIADLLFLDAFKGGQTGGQVLEQTNGPKTAPLDWRPPFLHTCTRNHHRRCLVEWRSMPKQLPETEAAAAKTRYVNVGTEAWGGGWLREREKRGQWQQIEHVRLNGLANLGRRSARENGEARGNQYAMTSSPGRQSADGGRGQKPSARPPKQSERGGQPPAIWAIPSAIHRTSNIN